MALDATRLVRSIVEQATASDDGAALIEGFCRALIDAGLPLWRLSIGTPALDPNVRGFSFNWRRDEGPTLIAAAHSAESEAAFKRSPVHALLSDGGLFRRWRLDTLPVDVDMPLLHDLRAEGGTDYVLHMIGFSPGTALIGVAVAFASNRHGGFDADDLAALAEVLPAFGLATCKLSLARTLHDSLAVYLGPATSARVLDGEIRRGQGQMVSAAILLADLSGFTALTERADPMSVVGWLDEHFDALGTPVALNGGEILKFMGDGFLAIFPVSDPGARPCPICGAALEAAEAARRANTALNGRRQALGLPELEADLVLHFGEVVYGNVGTSRRLDFTVIGRAVNEASRIETLCGGTGHSLLLSDTFAERCGRPLVSLGAHPLRGLDRPQNIWTVARSAAAVSIDPAEPAAR